MASTRSTFFTQLVAQLATISGIVSSDHGKEPAQLDEYNEAELPLLYVLHNETDRAEKIPLKYKVRELAIVQIYYMDWNIKEDKTVAEAWLESIVEKVESDYTVNSSINYIDVKSVTIRDRDFPISSVEVKFEAVFHVNRTDF